MTQLHDDSGSETTNPSFHTLARRGGPPGYLKRAIRRARGDSGWTPILLLGIISNMKEFNIRHVQHHLADVLDAVERGEKVRITPRGKVVAQLGPPEPSFSSLRWPDATLRLQRLDTNGLIIKQLKGGTPASQTIDEDREERS